MLKKRSKKSIKKIKIIHPDQQKKIKGGGDIIITDVHEF